LATVVTADAPTPEHALGSAIVTLTGNTNITELHDLRGLRIAAAADDAFGGYSRRRARISESRRRPRCRRRPPGIHGACRCAAHWMP